MATEGNVNKFLKAFFVMVSSLQMSIVNDLLSIEGNSAGQVPHNL